MIFKKNNAVKKLSLQQGVSQFDLNWLDLHLNYKRQLVQVRETALSRMRGGCGFTKYGSKKLQKIVPSRAARKDFMQVWTNLCYRKCFCKTNCWKKKAFFLRALTKRVFLKKHNACIFVLFTITRHYSALRAPPRLAPAPRVPSPLLKQD